MKQIYDFESMAPPALTRRLLEKKLEQRKVQRETILVTLAGMLLQIAVFCLAILFHGTYPLFTWLAVGYCIFSLSGGGMLAVVYLNTPPQGPGRSDGELENSI